MRGTSKRLEDRSNPAVSSQRECFPPTLINHLHQHNTDTFFPILLHLGPERLFGLADYSRPADLSSFLALSVLPHSAGIQEHLMPLAPRCVPISPASAAVAWLPFPAACKEPTCLIWMCLPAAPAISTCRRGPRQAGRLHPS